MTFAQVPAAAAVFLDANTLVYHFTNHPTFGLKSSGDTIPNSLWT
jgi:hypothetical protein